MNDTSTRRAGARLLSAAVLALLLTTAIAACTDSDDDSTDVSTDTGVDDSDTTDSSSDTTADDGDTTDTTADSGDTTSSTGDDDDAAAAVPEGSGCAPGETDSLPDGRWFGFVSAREPDSFSFDLACWFTGEQATLAAAEDGAESPPPNDYHIRNDNPTERLLIPATEVAVEYLAEPGDPASVLNVDYPTWVSEAGARPVQPGVWVEIVDGMVSAVTEQYVP